MAAIRHLTDQPPSRAADAVLAEAGEEWTRAFVAELGRRMQGEALERVLTVWDLPAAGAAKVFGVSRQALAKWRTGGVPEDRLVVLADLAAATDLLLRYVRPDRIPAVVRRPAPVLGGASLLELAQDGRTAEVRGAVAAMVDLRRVAP
jgi:hypothetical protein